MRRDTMRATGLLLLFAALLAGAPVGADEIAPAASSPGDWTPVQGAPAWLAGVAPGGAGRGPGWFELDRGESTLISLAGQTAVLVVQARPSETGLDDLVPFLSEDGSLFVRENWRAVEPKVKLLHLRPVESSQFLRLVHGGTGAGAVAFGVFLLPEEESMGRFRRVYEASGAAARITTGAGTTTDDRHWLVEPGSPLRFPVSGPSTLRLDSRYRYRADDGRSRQTYRLLVRAGTRAWSLEHVTYLSSRADLMLDDLPEALGNERVDYLQVPEGRGELVVEATGPVYVRLRGIEHDRLFRRNRAASGSGGEPATTVPSLGAALDPMALAREGEWGLGRLAGWLARDNRFRGSRSQLVDMERALGETDAPSGVKGRWAQAVLQSNEYEDLVPSQSVGSEPLAYRSFLLPGSSEGGPRARRFHPEFGLDALAGLSSGTFVRVGEGSANAARYALPDPTVASCLRLAVDRQELTEPARLRLSSGGLAPIEIEILPPDPAASGRLGRTVAELAIAGVGSANAGKDAHARRGSALPLSLQMKRRLGGAADLWSRAYPVKEAAVGRLCLEVPADSFELWADSAGLEAAVQVLSPVTFRLSEGEYRHHVEVLARAGWTPGDLFSHLTDQGAAKEAAEEVSAAERIALDALANHWLPLARSLRAAARVFETGLHEPARSVSPATAVSEEAAGPPPEDPVQRLARLTGRERKLGTDAELLAAKVAALDASGEHYLAERSLRHAVLHSSADVAERASSILRERYERAGDSDSRLRLAASAALARPSRAALTSLTAALVDSGRMRDALSLAALGIGAPPEAVLLAAATERWWSTFESVLSSLDTRPRELWVGYRALLEGRHEAARSSLKRAGKDGARALDSLRQSRKLAEARASAGGSPSIDWRRWEAVHPGRYGFVENRSLVEHADGSEWVRIAHMDRPISYLRASPARPLEIRAHGPARLRIEVRPLVGGSEAEPDDLWLNVDTGDGSERFLLRRGESGVLSLVRDGAELQPRPRIGSKTEIDVVVGEGQATFRIFAEGARILARAFAWQPYLPTTSFEPTKEKRTASRSKVDLRDGREWLCRAGSGEPRAQSCEPVDDSASLVIADQWSETTATPPARVQFFPRGTAGTEAELYRTMAGYVLALESGSADRARQAVAYGEALAWENRGESQLQPLHSRLVRDATWERLRSVEASAGIRRIEGAGWSPEEPALRVRSSLLGVGPTDLVVVGRQRLGLAISSRAPTRFRVTFELAQVPPLTQLALEARTTIDGRRLPPVLVDRDNPVVTRTVKVAPGDHELAFSIAQPRANQYLRLRVEELRSTGSVPQLRSWQRNYHVATADRPLNLQVDAPAWLRIDELRNGSTISSYRLVDGEGWRRVEIAPSEGQTSAMYRVFRRTLGEPSDPLESGGPDAEVEVLQRLGSMAAGVTSLPTLATPDYGRLVASQGAGTTTVQVGFERRRPLEDELGEEDEADEFTVVSLEHRRGRRLAVGSRHQEYRLFSRLRPDGDASAGGELRARAQLGAGDWVVNANLAGYAQELESEGTAWSATARVHLARTLRATDSLSTRFQISGFARELSLDESFVPSTPTAVDQDVFTTYKARHLHGIRLAQGLTWRPRRDFNVWSQIALNSNESLGDLDNAVFELAFRELVGPLRLDFAARFVRYFEDTDRASAVDRQRASLRWAWERWTRKRGRWEIGGRLSYDLRAGDYSGLLHLSRHFSGGRGLEDFRPSAGGFHALREERQPASGDRQPDDR